jgi:hypothetical protein
MFVRSWSAPVIVRQALLAVLTVLAAWTILIGYASPSLAGNAWCQMCGGDANCKRFCEEKLPRENTPPPSSPASPSRPPTSLPQGYASSVPAGYSQRNVEFGDKCNVPQNIRNATGWGSAGGKAFGGPYGGANCCCHGGADAPIIVVESDSSQKCYCPDRSRARTEKCLSNFEGAGHCGGCDKVAYWSSAVSGWITDAAERMAYCCTGCRAMPTLHSREFIKDSHMVEPLCTCPAN